jgi:hypothetical protein
MKKSDSNDDSDISRRADLVFKYKKEEGGEPW